MSCARRTLDRSAPAPGPRRRVVAHAAAARRRQAASAPAAARADAERGASRDQDGFVRSQAAPSPLPPFPPTHSVPLRGVSPFERWAREQTDVMGALRSRPRPYPCDHPDGRPQWLASNVFVRAPHRAISSCRASDAATEAVVSLVHSGRVGRHPPRRSPRANRDAPGTATPDARGAQRIPQETSQCGAERDASCRRRMAPRRHSGVTGRRGRVSSASMTPASSTRR